MAGERLSLLTYARRHCALCAVIPAFAGMTVFLSSGERVLPFGRRQMLRYENKSGTPHQQVFRPEEKQK